MMYLTFQISHLYESCTLLDFFQRDKLLKPIILNTVYKLKDAYIAIQPLWTISLKGFIL